MYVKTVLHTTSHIFPVGINKLCVSSARIWTFMAVLGSFVNSNFHSLVDIIFLHLGVPLLLVYFWMLIFHRD